MLDVQLAQQVEEANSSLNLPSLNLKKLIFATQHSGI